MTPRDTSTGRVLESMILPALTRGGYDYRQQAHVGARPSGTRHRVDVEATSSRGAYLISLKWQQVSGTAEQKVPFEVICLLHAVRASGGRYRKAYLVLGGEGWSLRDFYVEGGLDEYLPHSDAVEIMTLEAFVAKANQGEL